MDKVFDRYLETLDSDSARFKALIGFVDKNHRHSPVVAAYYGEKLMQLSGVIQDLNLVSEAYILSARTLWFQSDFKKALDRFEEGLKLAKTAGNRYLIVQALNGIGNVYGDRELFDEALKYYFEAIKIAETDNNYEYMVALYNNLGEIYKRFRAYDKALEHYEMAVRYITDEFLKKKPYIYVIVRQNIAEIEMAKGDYKKARSILLECIELSRQSANDVSLSSALHILAKIEMKDAKYHEAMDAFEESMVIFEKIHDRVNQVDMLLSYAKAHRDLNHFAEAERLLLMALQYAEETEQPHILSNVTSALAEFYECNGLFEKALQLYKTYHDTDKKSERVKTEQRLSSVAARFESEESKRRSEQYQTATQVYKERTEDLEKAYERITMISNIGKRLTATQDLEHMYDYMYSSLKRIMPLDSFMIFVLDDAKKVLDAVYLVEGERHLEYKSIPVEDTESLTAWCYRNNHDIFSGNILSDYAQYLGTAPISVAVELMYSVIYLPIQYQSTVIGVMTAQCAKQNAFDGSHLDFLKALGAYLAIAIINANKSKALIEEIEQRKAAQAQLEALNRHLKGLSERDGLTGVANRHRLEAHIMQLANAPKARTVFIMMDIDFFKYYNDTYGHLQGDEALIEVAQYLDGMFNSHDGFFARYGGEEFVGILQEMPEDLLRDFVETLLIGVQDLKIPHEASPFGILTISLGVAVRTKSRTLEKTLRDADRALYLSKQTGRNKASMHE